MNEIKQNWEERYITGNLPWDSGRQDSSLEELIANKTISACKTLELGCGTGSNAIWLATKGFEVTATDISSEAISIARDKATKANETVNFMVMDILQESLPEEKYDFVFDRGCFHSFDGEERDTFAKSVYTCLKPAGIWLSLIGSADSPPCEMGPPRLTAQEIASRIEPFFKIKLLKTTHFDSDQPDPPPAWACLMQKRSI